MQLPLRSIAAATVIVAFSALAAGCSADGGSGPSASPTHSTTPTRSAAAGVPSAPATGPGSGTQVADSSGVPTAIPGSGETAASDPVPATPYPATAVVTYASWDTSSKTLQTAGLVTGTADTSGTCTFTATSGGTTRTATSKPTAGASSVSCPEATFPAAQVAAGTWKVTLTYAVGSSSTRSEPTTAEVP